MTTRWAWIAAGGGLVALAVALPALSAGSPDAMAGIPVARFGLTLSGLVALAVGVLGRALPSLAAGDRLSPAAAEGRDVRRPLPWLAAITVLAAAIRLDGIDRSLWLDEIITVFLAQRPLADLLAAPPGTGIHPLHSLLVRGAIGIAGYEEWAIRLPAVVLGVATVPALYVLARVSLRSREALLAALVLATSYTHVFFSQNSRGYAGFVCWTALATWFLLRALTRDRGRDWWGYAVSSFLAGATLLLGVFALLGQAAALFLVAARVRRAGGRAGPVLAKGLAVMGAVGLALFDWYALALSGLYRHARPVAAPEPLGAGNRNPFWEGLRWGLEQAFGSAGLVALVILALLLAPGMIRFLRRQPILCAYLAAPLVVQLAAVLSLRLFAAPRYFLWAIVPFSIGIMGAAASLRRGAAWAAPVMAALLVAGSLYGLVRSRDVPFQAGRESIQLILERSAPGDVVVPVTVARPLARYYGQRLDLFRTRAVHPASSMEELRSIERTYPERRIWLLTSKRSAIAQFQPDLADHIDRCYPPVRMFPSRMRGMEVTVHRGPCR